MSNSDIFVCHDWAFVTLYIGYESDIDSVHMMYDIDNRCVDRPLLLQLNVDPLSVIFVATPNGNIT